MTRKKMNVEFKTKWLKALRSGDFIQGKDGLKKLLANRFCCLGVLCDVSEMGEWVNGAYKYKEQASELYIPTALADEFGITKNTQDLLAEKNDAGEDDFNAIADWIEANL